MGPYGYSKQSNRGILNARKTILREINTRATQMSTASKRWNFAIDEYLNPWIPRPPWQILPYPLTHFLGYRKGVQRQTNHGVTIIWATIGVFSGLTIIELVGQQIPSFQAHGTPLIVGSFVSHVRPIEMTEHLCLSTGSCGCSRILRHRVTTGAASKRCCQPSVCFGYRSGNPEVV